jgi:uncharacterized protein
MCSIAQVRPWGTTMETDQLTRVGVLSDTHLRGVTRDLEEIWTKYLADADLILHAGDVVCVEVVRFLQQSPFHGVHGNMDPPEVRELLPSHKTIEIENLRVGITHGLGAPEGLEKRVVEDFKDVDLIVFGHSHSPIDHVKHGVRFFNPGTATGPIRYGSNSIGILDFGDDRVIGRIIIV